MSSGGAQTAAESLTDKSRPTSVRDLVARFGVGHLVPGLLGLAGPLVWGNDDDGAINTDPGLFLGVVAVNGYHSLMHVAVGLAGLAASRDGDAARTYLGASAVLFSTLAAVGWRRFGFERGVHAMGPLAVDGWGNLGHTVLAGLSAAALAGARSDRDRGGTAAGPRRPATDRSVAAAAESDR